jgi:hypothetical protein
VDDDGAGLGWQYTLSTSSLTTPGYSYDLLAVLTHELGHAIGLDHDEHSIMAPVLQPAMGGHDHHDASGVLADLDHGPVGDGLLIGLVSPNTSGVNDPLLSSRSGADDQELDAVDRVLTDSLLDDLRIREADAESPDLLEDLVQRDETDHDELDAIFAEL